MIADDGLDPEQALAENEREALIRQAVRDAIELHVREPARSMILDSFDDNPGVLSQRGASALARLDWITRKRLGEALAPFLDQLDEGPRLPTDGRAVMDRHAQRRRRTRPATSAAADDLPRATRPTARTS